MSATTFAALAILLPGPQSNTSPNGPVVNESIGFELHASKVIRTLSSNNPNNFDVIQGLLYVPDLSGFDKTCGDSDTALIPANVTRKSTFQNADYPVVAFAPWTSSQCVQSYMSMMRAEAVRGAIFYKPDGSDLEPPPVTDSAWDLGDGGKWRSQNQFPIYALPGAIGTIIINSLAAYSGNMSSAPNGDQLTQQYNPSDFVRLFAQMDVSGNAGIPSLWVFLIIVLAILLAIVLITSVIMHMIQRRQRVLLTRRVAAGEVDLEALGIKRLNVPQDQLNTMPQYTYTSKAEGNIPIPNVREVPFTQSTCPICLDDFVHGETTIRELPCKHIFHPECIDPFLRDNSSLCPMCKKSALPAGYCPVHVTNLMVRRERLIRRMRQRANAENGTNPPVGRRATMVSAMQRRVTRLSMPPAAVLGTTHHSRGTTNGASNEMQNIDAIGARRRTGLNAPTNSAAPGTLAAGEEPVVPAEVESQGTAARRAWLRQQLARQQELEYSEAAQEAREVDERRPLWRRIAGRFSTRWE